LPDRAEGPRYHDFGTGLERGFRGFRLVGIDRDRWAGRCNCFDDRHDASDFIIRRHGRVSRSGRLAADIDDVGSLSCHRVRMSHSRLAQVEETAIGEAVGRDIEDAHNQRPPPEVGQYGNRRWGW
jgi:hypothetical protein